MGLVCLASKIRSSVNVLISIDDSAAPWMACFQGTPTNTIGGAISAIRRTVQPASAQPDPFSRSRMPATVRYVGSLGATASTGTRLR